MIANIISAIFCISSLYIVIRIYYLSDKHWYCSKCLFDNQLETGVYSDYTDIIGRLDDWVFKHPFTWKVSKLLKDKDIYMDILFFSLPDEKKGLKVDNRPAVEGRGEVRMINKYCDKCGSVFVCSCDGKSYISGGFRYNSCWPVEKRIIWSNLKTLMVPIRKPVDIYYPTHNIIIPGIHEMTIPQLLDQAEQVRNARRPTDNQGLSWSWVGGERGKMFTTTPENPKGDYDL